MSKYFVPTDMLPDTVLVLPEWAGQTFSSILAMLACALANDSTMLIGPSLRFPGGYRGSHRSLAVFTESPE